MRYLFAIPFIAASLAVAGCDTTNTPTAADMAAFVDQVQSAAKTACAFVPTAETVASIAAAQSVSATAGVAVADKIADSICGAVTAKGAKPGFKPTVDGVEVKGSFVK